jgi:ABC-type multidrug transport system fused ATPase/permease subunit
VIAYIAYYATDWSGSGLIEGVSVGLLVAFIDALNRIYVPIREFSGRLATIQRALAALDRILALTDIHEEIRAGQSELSEIKGAINFDHVSFRYSEDSSPVLDEVSFQVSPGEVVALVGSTGSGKSTVARLLSRQYQGFTGEVTLDGARLETLSSQTIRDAIIMVGQDPYLFKASISENIHLWDQELMQDEARLLSATRRACAHTFIENLPDGYQTICASGGTNLSAGQRQLITIARAFMREAPVVILDEATASVDALTEQLIDEATAQLFKERTVLVIAHRLSTITKADRIMMLSQGKVIEQGTHTELLELDGAYARLVQTELKRKIV